VAFGAVGLWVVGNLVGLCVGCFVGKRVVGEGVGLLVGLGVGKWVGFLVVGRWVARSRLDV